MVLQELENRGDTVLGQEVAAFLEALQDKNPSTELPYSRRLLAQAAQILRDGSKDDISMAHDYLGASLEVFNDESTGRSLEIPNAVTASLNEELAPVFAFNGIEQADMGNENGESPNFDEAPEEVVNVLANLLLNGGYVEEARRYLTEYNSRDERDSIVATKSTKKELKDLQEKYRKGGDLVRARALEEVLSDLDEDLEVAEDESTSSDEDILTEEEGTASDCGEEETEDKAVVDEDDDRPELPVEPASAEECEEKEEAQAALASGNVKKAKKHLAKAAKLERLRITAALIKVGDMELAMAGLDVDDEITPEDKAGGFVKIEDEANGADDEELEMEDVAVDTNDDIPTEEETAKREEMAKEDAPEEDEIAEAIGKHVRTSIKAGKMVAAKDGLKDLASLEKAIVAGIQKAEEDLKNPVLAKEGYDVWKEVRKINLDAMKVVAEEEGDDEQVQKANDGLEALEDEETNVEDVPPVADDDMPNVEEAPELPVADEEAPVADEEAPEEDEDETEIAEAIAHFVRKSARKGQIAKAKEGLNDLKKLSTEIAAGIKLVASKDKDLAEEGRKLLKEVKAITLKATRVVACEEGDTEKQEEVKEDLGKLDYEDELSDSLDSEPNDDNEEEEADAMKYEVLQNIEDIKSLDVDRHALAFTYWDSKEDPYWAIQAAGKPIAEVHLNDQNNPEDVSAFFCDQAKWPNVIAQTTEKVGLYEMLEGVNARFYAHGVTKTDLAKKLKKEVEASLKETRSERLGSLRTDFTESMIVAASALNKGLISGKSNPLKKAFVDKLSSLGFSHPAPVVEECFAAAFQPYLEQIIADAGEYLEMPTEAFAHTKKMVATASNMAVAQASQFGDETLSARLSRRSMPLGHSEEAHEAPSEVEASILAMSASEKHGDIKKRLRLGSKF